MRNLSTGTWASIDDRCPMNRKVEGSDFVTILIGDDDQSVELTFNAEGMRQLAEISGKTVTKMDALAQATRARAEAERVSRRHDELAVERPV